MPSAGEYPKRDLSGLRFIVWHHSAVEYDSDAAGIARFHIGLGWQSIGYAYNVRWDGTIEWAHAHDVQGNTVARRNPECLSFCCPGDYTKRGPRPLQFASGLWLARHLHSLYPWTKIVGHGEIALPGYGTSCPGSLIEAMRAAL